MRSHRPSLVRGVSLGVILLLLGFALRPVHSLMMLSNDSGDAMDFGIEYSYADLTPHSPIVINGDSDFSDQGWPGQGTEEDPYRIQNLDITVGESETCIRISDTSVFFEIRNCLLTSTAVTAWGIVLDKVRNGLIINNTCVYSGIGIYLLDSTQNTVDLNKCCNQSLHGILIDQSDDNRITDNTCDSNGISGIQLIHSDDNTVFHNTCTNNSYGIVCNSTLNTLIEFNSCTLSDEWVYSGIRIENSNYTIAEKNTCFQCTIGIEIIGNSTHNIVSGNVVTEFVGGVFVWSGPAEDQEGMSHNVVIDNGFDGIPGGATGVYLQDSSHDVIESNYITDCEYGIALWESPGARILNNLCDDPFMEEGIHVYYSNFTVIDSNKLIMPLSGMLLSNMFNVSVTNNSIENILGSGTGIECHDLHLCEIDNNSIYGCDPALSFDAVCTNNTLRNNLFQENIRAVEMDTACSNNFAEWNIFLDNQNSAQDNGSSNFFDYNYWSSYLGVDGNGDGYGDTPHPLPGTASNEDSHPLTFYPYAPSWSFEPFDILVEYAHGFTYELDVIIPSGAAPIDYWWISDTLFFTIDDNGSITEAVQLPIGVYRLEVSAYNIYGISVSGDFTVTVDDTIPPTVDDPPDITYVEGTVGNTIVWLMSDAGPSGYVVTLDGSVIMSGQWNLTSETLTIICDGLSVGLHTYEITITDLGGNSAIDTIIVTVTPSFIPLIITAWAGVIAVFAGVVVCKRRSESPRSL